MRIIYIADIRLPTEKAHGIQIMKMCEAFGFQGLNIELIIPKRFNPIKKNPFEYYGVKRNFEIKKIFSFDLTFFWPILRSLSFWWQSFWFAIFSSLQMLFKKSDIIYSRDSLPLFFLSFFRENLVYEIHTFPKTPFLYKRIFKRVKKFIVITQKLKDLLLKIGISEDKILVAPDAVDLKEFEIEESQKQCRKKLNLPLDKKIVLYTGHLFEWKGATVLLEAARNFQFPISNFQNILFIFVGGTEKDIENFKLKISNLKLNNVLMVGHRPHMEIPYWLKAADILVLPNSSKEKISQFYTSPLKMFEYMTSQKPIVASDLPSIREILNENNAILVRPDDPRVLAEGIQKALKNKDLSGIISQKAYSDVREYTWQKRAKNILDFIIKRAREK